MTGQAVEKLPLLIAINVGAANTGAYHCSKGLLTFRERDACVWSKKFHTNDRSISTRNLFRNWLTYPVEGGGVGT